MVPPSESIARFGCGLLRWGLRSTGFSGRCRPLTWAVGERQCGSRTFCLCMRISSRFCLLFGGYGEAFQESYYSELHIVVFINKRVSVGAVPIGDDRAVMLISL